MQPAIELEVMTVATPPPTPTPTPAGGVVGATTASPTPTLAGAAHGTPGPSPSGAVAGATASTPDTGASVPFLLGGLLVLLGEGLVLVVVRDGRARPPAANGRHGGS